MAITKQKTENTVIYSLGEEKVLVSSVEKGENVIGLILGNGFQNNPGGYIWYFDQASFRSAPMVSLILT